MRGDKVGLSKPRPLSGELGERRADVLGAEWPSGLRHPRLELVRVAIDDLWVQLEIWEERPERRVLMIRPHQARQLREMAGEPRAIRV